MVDDSFTIESMAKALLKKDKNVFGQFFTNGTCIGNVDSDTRERADKIFKEVFSDCSDSSFNSFEDFLKEWKKNKIYSVVEDYDSIPQSDICNKFSFDPSKREMVSVVGPRRKKNPATEFDVYEFLKTRHESGCPIRFPSDVELEADLEVLMEPQKHAVVDAGLRKIARALTVLNSSCSYRLLDVHSERVIR